jgi:UDP-GlcNAc:undecaprenyl-phosphate GlcNAc-1-phosphate transferase
MTIAVVVGLVAALAFVLTATITPALRAAALGAGLVRQARTDRWHRRPTPAIGGIAIYVGFGIALGVGFLLDPEAVYPLTARAPHALLPWTPRAGLLAAGTLVFLVGLADDLLAFKPLQKLAGQLVAAAVLVLSGIGVWATGQYVVDGLLSVLWFVAIANAMNLLDNMDGLAAGIAAIAAGYLSLLFFLEGQTGLLLLSFAFLGALLGFLTHNYPPARIFMGDSGSLFLGLFLAGLSLSPAPGLSRSLFAVVAVPVLILAIPILDSTLVTLGRVLEGRPITQGGKDHTSHRLVAIGASEERALWLLWGLALAGGAVALLVRSAERSTAYLLGGVLLLGLVLVGAYLLSVRFRAMKSEEVARVPLYRLLVSLHDRYPVLPFVLDAALVGLAYFGAYLVRWDPSEIAAQLPYFRSSLLVVVAIKLLAFVVGDVYSPRWHHFGLDDGLRVLRANLLGSLASVVALLLINRLGLSRGVIVIDFMLCSTLIVGSRLLFRFLEGASGRWAKEGTPVVVLGFLDEIDLAVRQLERLREPHLRPVAVADPAFPRLRSRMGAYRLYGGPAALENALHDTRSGSVVLIGRAADAAVGEALATLADYLETHGSVDVYRLRVTVEAQPELLRGAPLRTSLR